MSEQNIPGSAELQLGIVGTLLKPGNGDYPAGVQSSLEWYSRGYLPHCDRIGLLQSITFRLADSLPQELLKQLELEVACVAEDRQQLHRRKLTEKYMDSGLGCCVLQHPAVADIVQNAFLKFDGVKYRLIAWCIMPNHVHVLIEPLIELGKIVQSWKAFTGRWVMQHNAGLELGVPGKSLWMREYWDRYIRNEEHQQKVIEYIHQNPVKARLCQFPESWRWSSAFQGKQYLNVVPQK
ncbi:transposase [Chlorobium limicola]|uniref:transposase n=1 Tax=Chlorobium limicola TaxID=1092 RepID=UPI0009E7327C|nr:transposase [Chlorobium limicola]